MAQGERGEICLRARSNPHYPLGYWRNPEASQETFGGDWFHSKDAATADEDGYIWYDGRADDVIIAAGYRIGPFEVGVGVPGARGGARGRRRRRRPTSGAGNVVKAFIVLAEGHEPSDELADEHQARSCATGCSAYAYPRLIEFVADLPKTLTGKIRRIELREREARAAGRRLSQPSRRATAKSSPPVLWPATTIRPFGWSATALPNVATPKSTVAFPPAPNVASGRSVGVEARDRDVLGGLRVAGDDDLAVRLQHRVAARSASDPKSIVAVPSPSNVVSSEPFGLQARDGHHLASARVARDDDLAVRLHQHGARAAAPGQRHAAVAAEVRVERAGRPQPRDHGAGGRRPAGHEDAPVGLARHRLAEVVAAEVDRGVAAGAERRVERAVRRSGARPGCSRPRAPRSRRAGACRSAARARPWRGRARPS